MGWDVCLIKVSVPTLMPIPIGLYITSPRYGTSKVKILRLPPPQCLHAPRNHVFMVHDTWPGFRQVWTEKRLIEPWTPLIAFLCKRYSQRITSEQDSSRNSNSYVFKRPLNTRSWHHRGQFPSVASRTDLPKVYDCGTQGDEFLLCKYPSLAHGGS